MLPATAVRPRVADIHQFAVAIEPPRDEGGRHVGDDFRAHADLRVAFEGFEYSHASIMHNVLTRAPSIGRLVQVGTPRQIYEDPVDSYVATRLGSPGINLLPIAMAPGVAAPPAVSGSLDDTLMTSRLSAYIMPLTLDAPSRLFRIGMSSATTFAVIVRVHVTVGATINVTVFVKG